MGVQDSTNRKESPSRRKDRDARRDLMREVDLAVLCLPDAAARESVALAAELGADAPKLLDASTAHRVDPAWVYGWAEMAPGQAERIAAAPRVANPGCYATSVILALAPLTRAHLVDLDRGIIADAKSGVSGAGKSPTPTTHFMYAADNLSAYAVFGHRHTGELLEQLHRASAERLLRLLARPHRLLVDAHEVHLHATVRRHPVRRGPQLDDHVHRPGVVAVERTLLDVVARELVGRVLVQRPLEHVGVERDG